MTKIKTALGLTAAITLALTAMTSAGETKMFRATGNISRATGSMLVLRTPAQDLEVTLDAKTKIVGKISTGVAATVHYDKVNGQPHATLVTVTPGRQSTVIN